MKPTDTTGIIFFAHGSRDPQWRLPFEAILEAIRTRHTGPSALAFLECMTPSLPEAISAMASQGAGKIRVVPVFLAVGSHVRKDLPALIEQAQRQHPDLPIEVTASIGEQSEIQSAIADFALRTG